mgnify:CR=1 FL=1
MAIEYIPLPPPQNPEGMATYLNNELLRLSQAISAISTTARGSLYLAASSATQVIGTTPALLTVFDTEIDPASIDVNITTDSITALFRGASGAASVFAKTSGEPVSLSLTAAGQVPRGGKLEVFASVASGSETLTFTRLRWGVSGTAID